MRCQLGSEGGRTQNVEGDPSACSGDRPNTRNRAAIAKKCLELKHIVWERIRGVRISAQRPHGGYVGSRRSSEPEVDAAWMEFGERPKLFGDSEW